MISFVLVNNFSNNAYNYGLNFEIENNQTTFISSQGNSNYLELFKTIIKHNKNATGHIYFDKYELVHMDYKMRSRFIYNHLSVYDESVFYDGNISVYKFLKLNWSINHLNTKDFDDFFENFIIKTKISPWRNKIIKYLNKEQKLIIGLLLALFNKKKYFLINYDLDNFDIEYIKRLQSTLNLLNQNEITILWFSNKTNILKEQFKHIDINDKRYDKLNNSFIVNDDVFLASKFTLNIKKWFSLSTILFRRSNILISLLYILFSILLFSVGLFFATQPITLFKTSIGIITTNDFALLIGIIFLIGFMILTFIYCSFLYFRARSYLRFLMYSGVPRMVLYSLICFIILVFMCAIVFSSYIILLIMYISSDVLSDVKWVSSIYFPISIVFFNSTCAILCCISLKNNLIEKNRLILSKQLPWNKKKR